MAKGKTPGGEGTGARSFPNEQASNKNDKHPGLKPIGKVTVPAGPKGGAPKGGGPVVGCGTYGKKDRDGDRD